MVIRSESLRNAIDLFEVYCHARGLANSTQETYGLALTRLEAYLAPTGAEIPVPTREELRGFIASMLAAGLSRQTVRVRMRAIRVFCNYLEREGLVGESPMRGVEIPKVPTTLPDVLSPIEARRLLAAARTSSWCGTRNHAMIATFLDTGVRLSELIGLDLNDLDLSARTLRVRNGKWSKDRVVYAGQFMTRAIRAWLSVRSGGWPCAALFVTRSGDRLDRRNVGRIVQRAARRAGLAGRRVHPHLLRHTFATHYVANGGDPFSLQRILGHSDIKTTTIYVNLAGVGLREAHAKASPVDCLPRH